MAQTTADFDELVKGASLLVGVIYSQKSKINALETLIERLQGDDLFKENGQLKSIIIAQWCLLGMGFLVVASYMLG